MKLDKECNIFSISSRYTEGTPIQVDGLESTNLEEKHPELLLLTTQFSLPLLPPNFISRPHLVKYLNIEIERKIIVITAPAGYGKTTLLREWISQAMPNVVWIALDANDRYPIRFWRHVIVALEAVRPGISEIVLPWFQLRGSTDLEAALIVLINEITILNDKLVFTFDNYATINASSVHQGMSFFLNHLPPNMRAIISSRNSPPLSLARLRAQGQILEITTDKIRFTPVEMEKFISQEVHSEDIIASLKSYCQGWITGSSLIVQYFRDYPNISRLCTIPPQKQTA